MRYTCLTLLTVLTLLLASTACNPQGPEPEATPEHLPTSVPTTEPTATEAPPDPMFGFKQGLIGALNTPRNYEELPALMGDSFEILIWHGNGEQLTPPDAANALRNVLLPPGNPLSFEEADIAAVLGIDPHDFYGNLSVVDFVLTRGWGADGADEALIVIGQRPDGSYYWHGILLAIGSFDLIGPGVTTLDMFREHLIQAWMPATRDLAYLEDIMADPFIVAGVFAIYYEAPLPPAEALTRMQAEGILQATDPSIVTNDLDAIREQVNYDFSPMPPDEVDYVWAGQTDDGTQNVILVIGEDADGDYVFASVRLIPVGFKTPVDFAREQILQAWMPDTRDLTALEGLMLDPFYIAGPMAYIYGPIMPAEAIAQMQTDTVLATNIDPASITNDLERIQQGTNFDPAGAIPDAIDYVWVGQSDDGQYNVILVINPNEMGELGLAFVLLIPVNFEPPS